MEDAWNQKDAVFCCLIKVQKKKVTVSKLRVSASKVYLKKGQKLKLKTSVTPLTATDKVRYISSGGGRQLPWTQKV